MANTPVPGSTRARALAAPVATATCPGCGEAVDRLRAGHVAFLEGGFRYFCRAECKAAYLAAHGAGSQEDVQTARPPEVAARLEPDPIPRPIAAVADVANEVAVPPPRPPVEVEPPPRSVRATVPSFAYVGTAGSPPSVFDRALPVLDATGIVLGALIPAVGLLGSVADGARLPLVLACFAALSLRFAVARRERTDAHVLVTLVPAAGSVAAALWSAVAHDAHATGIAVLAGLTCAVGIVVEMVLARARTRSTDARRAVLQALDVRARVVRGDTLLEVPAGDVRPGETVVVEAGEVIAVDGTVAKGDARVVPWLGATTEVGKREGDPVPAGARVVSGRLRLTTAWAGRDRAWVRLLGSRDGRVDAASPTPRTVKLVVERGTPAAALLTGLAAFAGNATPVQILAAACAGATAFAAKAAASYVAMHVARAHLDALASGITYKDARAFERAAAVNVAVLCARGTALTGEPEIVAVEPIGGFDAEHLLALAAGAETTSSHPFATAILRAARTRGVVPDAVRGATPHAGRGVTASASTGERLVVGGRAIMLEEKVGVAAVDARVSELEAMGRSVLLVALGDRLVGLIALLDGLRAGARAAVQRILDTRIEPVLLSGEARDTCETIARALEVEHVRPEVLPADRGAEVRALADGGSVVAAIGHPGQDDGALGAASVAVAMGAAGSTPGEWAVATASDDVRDAVASLVIPHQARERARVTLVLGAAPGIAALLAIAFGIAPYALAPVAALVGAVAAAVHARESSLSP